MRTATPQPAIPGISVLILDDEPEIRSEIKDYLSRFHVEVHEAGRPSEAFHLLTGHHVDIAILDIRLPEMNGIAVLREIKRCCPTVSAIMVSGHGEMDDVIEALRIGAVDYFRKPFRVEELYTSIEKILHHIQFNRTINGEHQAELLKITFGDNGPGNMVASDSKMLKVIEQMRLVARSDNTTVLITGESGTGKEVAARAIHQMSKRRDKPFHTVNCSSIPDELFESEFFGYEKGAFTGAYASKPGWFESANQGTLFLDEIADLKPALQAKLLRIMEDGNVSRLGSTKSHKVDVRIVAATNKDLEQMVKEGSFREDLFYRLHLFTLHLPPLRERKEDIPLLLAQFIKYYSHKMGIKPPRLSKEVMNAMIKYDFPGNVRELKHMVERALILCEGGWLTFRHFDHLELKLRKAQETDGSPVSISPLSLIEKDVILKALHQTHFNISKAARMLNISRQALSRKMKKLGIELQ